MPYTRPPDVPNDLGIGRADLSRTLPVDPRPVPEFGVVVRPGGIAVAGNTPAGQTTWPPVQELNMAIPKVGTQLGGIPVDAPLSPMCYPMHDHSEPSQTAQGGNYNQGLIAGMMFTGDRNDGWPFTQSRSGHRDHRRPQRRLHLSQGAFDLHRPRL